MAAPNDFAIFKQCLDDLIETTEPSYEQLAAIERVLDRIQDEYGYMIYFGLDKAYESVLLSKPHPDGYYSQYVTTISGLKKHAGGLTE